MSAIVKKLLATTDASVWTDEFMTEFGDRKDDIDWGLMVGWFANAIETGRNARPRPSPEVIAGMISTLEFTPSQEHPAECLPLAETIVREVFGEGLMAETPATS